MSDKVTFRASLPDAASVTRSGDRGNPGWVLKP